MKNRTVTVEKAIEILNEALETDPLAIRALFDTQVLCSQELGRHPTIQVGFDGENCHVTILGIINGLFGIDKRKWGTIAAHYDLECGCGADLSNAFLLEATTRTKCPACGALLKIGKLQRFEDLGKDVGHGEDQ